MQSMFRLPWSSEPPGDKIMEKSTVFHKPRPMAPVVDNFLMNKLKRKATDSPEPASPHHAHLVKKWKGAGGEVKPAAMDSDTANRANKSDEVVRVAPHPHPQKQQQQQQQLQLQSQSQSQQEPPRPAVLGKSGTKPDVTVKMEGAPKQKVPKTQKLPTVKPEPAPESMPMSATENKMTRMQQAIEAQVNMEILLKHNELRLIEQELAKCQVALEQLRRCQLVPYPGSQGPSQNVSGGVGPALQPPQGYTDPQYAAPWGVTDGPYTRHYAKWLIPDPKFDSMSERVLAAQSQGYFGLGEGRLTRGSFAEYPSSSKARTSRTSTGTLKLQALGENPAPAPKVDPLLHKRSTDGQWVRLYCAQCGHSNFSNTQGFLNHCRIKHNQVFKSHDAAAIACGVPVDVNESGNPVQTAEPLSATPLPTPTVAFPPPTTPGFVHPLVRSNPPEPVKNVHRDFSSKPAREVSAANRPDPAFQPSTAAPSLSRLLQKRGLSLDLKQIVDIARSHVDLDSMETSDDETSDSASQTPVGPHSKATASPQLARHPVNAPAVAKVPSGTAVGKKSHSNVVPRVPRTAVPPPVNVSGSASKMAGAVHGGSDSPLSLSPHTVESNPGLVSDHDDDDDEDADDAHSELHSELRDSDIAMSDAVVVDDGSDVECAERRARSRKGFGCFEKAEGSKTK